MGGFGICNYHVGNCALLAKWIWRFLHEYNALWRLLIVTKYYFSNCIWPLSIRGSSKSPWKFIFQTTNLVVSRTWHHLGKWYIYLPGLIMVFSQVFSLTSIVLLVFQISRWLMFGLRMLLLGICVFIVISWLLKLLNDGFIITFNVFFCEVFNSWIWTIDPSSFFLVKSIMNDLEKKWY